MTQHAVHSLRGTSLMALAANALGACGSYLEAIRAHTEKIVLVGCRIDSSLMTQHQRATHGYAWVATLVSTLDATLQWASRLEAQGQLTRVDELILTIGFGEYLAQLSSGLPMSQNEIVRPIDMGTALEAEILIANAAVAKFLEQGNTANNRAELIDRFKAGEAATDSIGDADLDMIRTEVRRFADERILPNAHGWHLRDDLVPEYLIEEMAELGVFGICVAPEFGGSGLGKLAMCVVTEELSRAWIATGSLGTRSEIACDLIECAGTDAQKQQWLPRIASGKVLPTAVFTEPDTGSDLANLKTRAVRREDGGWNIYGNKTWITHGSRSDLMTVLVRTDPTTCDHTGLSMMLAEKARGTRADPFPSAGLMGGEIEVLGYRGMREFDIAFDGFEVPQDGVLGLEEGQGFRQLMRTFEGARIQTAARAVGVARRAFELGFLYASERKQFGQAIIQFPRVSDKLALMATETIMVREITYFAARQKDLRIRCDIQAGMAKMLAARVAWTNADTALQVHGGNGYSLEYEISRILCDARILNIFEGAGEIQAQVIGRGLIQQNRAN